MGWDILTNQEVQTLHAPTHVIHVGLNGFGISRDRGLITQDVSGCTGIALLPQSPDGASALAHLNADPALFVQGIEGVKRHARHLWHKFARNLDETQRYHAVLFGNRRGEMPVHSVSCIIGETIFESLDNCSFITHVQDRRFTATRGEQAVINPATRQFALAEDVYFAGMDALEDAPRKVGHPLTRKGISSATRLRF